MRAMRFIVYIFLLFSFAFSPLLRADVIPSRVQDGIVFDAQITSEESKELRDYARNPTADRSSRILDLIIEKYPYSDLDFVKSKHVIAFLSINGINQVVHIGQTRRYYMKNMVDPDETHIPTRDLLAVWIVDNADIYVTSVEVDITKSTRSVHLSSFESSSAFESPTGQGESTLMEIGIKYFEIPIYSGNLDMTFVRRDLDTYEKRIWKRSFRTLAVPSFVGIGLEAGVFVPISNAETERFEIISDVITADRIEPVVFLTLTFFTPADRRFSRRFLENIIPDPFIGIGLPYDLGKANKNSYMVGFSWRYTSDLFRLSLGLQFSEKLLNGYEVGDIVAENEHIVDKYRIEPIAGISVSLTFISELLTGM